ncbi:hypothetical protein ACFQXA_30795 [Nocardiopsis composta]
MRPRVRPARPGPAGLRRLRGTGGPDPLGAPGGRPGDRVRHRPGGSSAALAAACALDGGAARERIGRWRELLRGAPREEAPGGFRAALPADRAAEAAELAAAEVRCCAFFTFSLEFDRTGTALRVSAPEQARPMLDEVFGAPEPAAPPAPPGKTCACSR